jgi:hypothetical protein
MLWIGIVLMPIPIRPDPDRHALCADADPDPAKFEDPTRSGFGSGFTTLLTIIFNEHL